MEYYEGIETFVVDESKGTCSVKEMLEKYGVAVLHNILNEDDCNSGYQGMWSYFEYISSSWETPMCRENVNSYRNFWKLFPIHSMLIQHWNAGHAQYVWDIRQNRNIVNVFSEHIWDCRPDDLLVSFDGISFHLPPEITNRGWFRNVWHHTDQSYLRPDFECVQGFVTLRDINPGDATLSFLEGSHKYHEEFREKFNITDKGDWYKIKTQEEANFYKEKGCIEKRITAPAGSLVLWDSRTIHCGVEPIKQRIEPNIRSIVYVCYMPRCKSTSAQIKKKQKAFDDLRMTTHWPCKSKLFAKSPRTYGAEIPNITQINPPELNELGLKLAGF